MPGFRSRYPTLTQLGLLYVSSWKLDMVLMLLHWMELAVRPPSWQCWNKPGFQSYKCCLGLFADMVLSCFLPRGLCLTFQMHRLARSSHSQLGHWNMSSLRLGTVQW